MKTAILSSVIASGSSQRVKRMSQMTTMAVHYDASWNNMKHLAYGCNCNMMIGDRPMSQSGHGQAIDELDATCKAYKDCQQCVIAHHGDECLGEFVFYDFSIPADEAICHDTPGTCERALCECDRQFTKAHAEKSDVYNQDFNHIFAMFDYEGICRKYNHTV